MNKFITAMRKNRRLTVLFSAFMFIQFIILRMSNQAGRGFLPEQRQERVYLYIQIIVIAGFFAHTLIKSLRRLEKLYKPLTAAALVLCVTAAALMLFSSAASQFYLAVTGLCVLFLGYIGGAVYYRMAALSVKKARAGLCLGAGYAIAVVFQFFLQLQWTVIPALAVLLLLNFASLAFILLKSGEDASPAEPVNSFVPRSTLFYTIVITVALLVFTSYYNSYIHHLQVASGYTDYNVYSWPRLLMIPAIVLFCAIGDLKGGKLLPISTLCVVVIALLNTALLARETYILNMCLYYIAMTAVIAYYHLTFLRLAPYTKHPYLWASMGRVLDSAAVILSFALNMSALSSVAVLIIDIVALVVVIVMMSLTGAFNLSASRAVQIPGDAQRPSDMEPVARSSDYPETDEEPIAQTDPFSVVKETYGISPSEMKVLRELVMTDDKQDVIAARLNISVSTLRHHITSIYKKTGTQTRSALCKLMINK